MSTIHPVKTTKTLMSQPQATKLYNIGSFLDAKEQHVFSQTCKENKLLFSESLTEKKKAREVLRFIFDGEPKNVREYLSRHKPSGKKCFLLTQSSSKEEYYIKEHKEADETNPSPKLQTFTCRVWNSVSPLEAAAWVGDNFLVKELIKFIPEELYIEAAKQLRGIINRKETEENGGYLAPFRAVILAYQTFMEEFRAAHLDDERDRTKMVELWMQLGALQKILPTYGLQEFCDEKPHDPVPTYKEEPKRICLLKGVFFNGPPQEHSRLRLYHPGIYEYSSDYFTGRFSGLFKGSRFGGSFACNSTCTGAMVLGGFGPVDDLSAMQRLIEVRKEELEGIIQFLLNPVVEKDSDLSI